MAAATVDHERIRQSITSHLHSQPLRRRRVRRVGHHRKLHLRPGRLRTRRSAGRLRKPYRYTAPRGVMQVPRNQGGRGAYVGGVASVTPGYAVVITVGGQGGGAGIYGDGGYGGYGGGAPGGNGGRHQSSGQDGFAGGGAVAGPRLTFTLTERATSTQAVVVVAAATAAIITATPSLVSPPARVFWRRWRGPVARPGPTAANGHCFDGVTGIGGGGGGGASANAGGGGGKGCYVVEPRGTLGQRRRAFSRVAAPAAAAHGTGSVDWQRKHFWRRWRRRWWRGLLRWRRRRRWHWHRVSHDSGGGVAVAAEAVFGRAPVSCR